MSLFVKTVDLDTLKPSLEMYKCSSLLYTPINRCHFTIKLIEIQQQAKGIDYGLFVLKNKVEFRFHRCVENVSCFIDPSTLHVHLIRVIESVGFEPFPTLGPTYHEVIITCVCSCRRPDCAESIAGCDGWSGF